MKTTNPISLAHDSFIQYGGAERVFESIHELYPTSPVYTLVKDPNMDRFISGWTVFTSPLQWLYNIHPRFTHLFAFIPLVLTFWKPVKSKILISFSSSFIKALSKPKDGIHINYCHTPTRFLWIDPEQAFKEIPKILHPFARFYFFFLKKWDLSSTKKIDLFIANSKEVQQRIKNIYNRESTIIYPFVDTNFWKPTRAKQNYFLIAGRLQYAKGMDVVVEVFNELGLPLHVVGTGRFESKLRSLAKENIKFLGRVTDEELRDEYSGARSFIYPQFEDFGIMPLEAASCGTATLGLAKGGSLETILDKQTGVLLANITSQTLKTEIERWTEAQYLQTTLISHAEQFSKERFQTEFSEFITKHTANYGN